MMKQCKVELLASILSMIMVNILVIMIFSKLLLRHIQCRSCGFELQVLSHSIACPSCDHIIAHILHYVKYILHIVSYIFLFVNYIYLAILYKITKKQHGHSKEYPCCMSNNRNQCAELSLLPLLTSTAVAPK